jgi:hypothetical protein
MNHPDKYRMERIERLLKELTYEIGVGIYESQIDHRLQYKQLFPINNLKYPALLLEFNLRPSGKYGCELLEDQGKLKHKKNDY